MRRKLPGYFASERETDKLKSRCKSEIAVMLEPTETKTGYKINPNQLVECLRFVYPWLNDIDNEICGGYIEMQELLVEESLCFSVSVRIINC